MRLRAHPLRLLILTFILGLLSLAAVQPTPVYACSCAPSSIDEARQQADAIFLGNVIAVDRHIKASQGMRVRLTRPFPFVALDRQWGRFTGPSHVTFELNQAWKGAAQQRVTIEALEQNGVNCGYSFEVGQPYLVYARDTGATLEHILCGRTRTVQEAQADVAALGPGFAPPAGVAPAAEPALFSPALLVDAVGLALGMTVVLAAHIRRGHRAAR